MAQSGYVTDQGEELVVEDRALGDRSPPSSQVSPSVSTCDMSLKLVTEP